jgi:hypothetical protein
MSNDDFQIDGFANLIHSESEIELFPLDILGVRTR